MCVLSNGESPGTIGWKICVADAGGRGIRRKQTWSYVSGASGAVGIQLTAQEYSTYGTSQLPMLLTAALIAACNVSM